MVQYHIPYHYPMHIYKKITSHSDCSNHKKHNYRISILNVLNKISWDLTDHAELCYQANEKYSEDTTARKTCKKSCLPIMSTLPLLIASTDTVMMKSGSCIRADPRLAPSQWETSLQSNAVFHWLGAKLESALCMHRTGTWRAKMLSSRWLSTKLQ